VDQHELRVRLPPGLARTIAFVTAEFSVSCVARPSSFAFATNSHNVGCCWLVSKDAVIYRRKRRIGDLMLVRMIVSPLAALAETQEQLRDCVCELAPAVPDEMRSAWEETARAALVRPAKALPKVLAELYLVLVTCRDEKQQVELLARFQARGWSARRGCREFASTRTDDNPERAGL
jgi:hypothetical protein